MNSFFVCSKNSNFYPFHILLFLILPFNSIKIKLKVGYVVQELASRGYSCQNYLHWNLLRRLYSVGKVPALPTL